MTYKVGDIVDVVADKKGRRWPIIKLHKGIYGFRDCPFFTYYNELGNDGPFEKSDAYKKTIEWLDENMAPEQRKRWGEPFLASLYNIVGKKAYEYAEPVEDEIQFDYYKDWHNRIKSCPDLSEEDETDFGSCYWTSSHIPSVAEGRMCFISNSGNSDYANNAYSFRGIAPCFAISEQINDIDDKVENEIGISLSKVYEAVTKGFWMVNFRGFNQDHSASVSIDFIDPSQMIFTPTVDFVRREIISTRYTFSFDDYGRTWALTKKELE